MLTHSEQHLCTLEHGAKAHMADNFGSVKIPAHGCWVRSKNAMQPLSNKVSIVIKRKSNTRKSVWQLLLSSKRKEVLGLIHAIPISLFMRTCYSRGPMDWRSWSEHCLIMIKRVLFESCFQSFFPQDQCLVVIKRSLVGFQVPPLHFFERYFSDFVSLVVNPKFSEYVGRRTGIGPWCTKPYLRFFGGRFGKW